MLQIPGLKTQALHLIAKEQAISDFTKVLTGSLHVPVVDNTGLNGKYDFTLDFSHDSPALDSADDSAPPTLSTALEEQLGLRLNSRKVSQETIVVDAVNKTPTDN